MRLTSRSAVRPCLRKCHWPAYPSPGKLVVSAMLPCPTGSAEHKPRAVLLADAFTVDEDGFLVAAGAG